LRKIDLNIITFIGSGDGGSRTRVQDVSAVASTCLVRL